VFFGVPFLDHLGISKTVGPRGHLRIGGICGLPRSGVEGLSETGSGWSVHFGVDRTRLSLGLGLVSPGDPVWFPFLVGCFWAGFFPAVRLVASSIGKQWDKWLGHGPALCLRAWGIGAPASF